MQGYMVLAQALEKNKVQNAYGIVGRSYFIQEFPSLNLDSPCKVLDLNIMGSETNNKQVMLLDTVDI